MEGDSEGDGAGVRDDETVSEGGTWGPILQMRAQHPVGLLYVWETQPRVSYQPKWV